MKIVKGNNNRSTAAKAREERVQYSQSQKRKELKERIEKAKAMVQAKLKGKNPSFLREASEFVELGKFNSENNLIILCLFTI